MKTLAGSTLKLPLVKYNDKYKGCFWCPRNVVLSIPEIHFLGCAKHVDVSFSLSVSSQREWIHPIFSASALSSSDTQTHHQDEEMQIPDENQSKTVHVKFQLQRECLFGQHFFIVGDDPIFGLWDTSKAIPLNWSDGHVWTAELDIPIGKLIKYKFILKGDEETILWQPGEDRVLQTWETRKTITIIEDWDNSEIQKIIEEEEPITEPCEEYAVYSELLMVAENLTQSSGNLKDDVNKELSNASGYSISAEKLSSENLMSTFEENTTEWKGELEVPGARIDSSAKQSEVAGVDTSESNGRATNGENLLVPDNNTNLVCEKEFPVLVPGMTPVATLQTEEPSLDAVKENAEADVSLGSDKADELSVAELNLKDEATETSDPQETTELMFNGNQELHEDQHLEKPHLVEGEDHSFTQPPENNVLEGDLQWGRRTLQKFLMNFGLL